MPGGRGIIAKGTARELLGTRRLVGWSCGSGMGRGETEVAVGGGPILKGVLENDVVAYGAKVRGAVVYVAVSYGAVEYDVVA